MAKVELNYHLKIIRSFIEKGAKPKHKHLMILAAMPGGDETVDQLRKTTNAWIEASR